MAANEFCSFGCTNHYHHRDSATDISRNRNNEYSFFSFDAPMVRMASLQPIESSRLRHILEQLSLKAMG
jgi:hypothetical protein